MSAKPADSVARRAAGAALVVGAAIAVTLASNHFAGRNFDLKPDAVEYAVVAYRFAAFESPRLPIGDQLYPTRYPYGLPLLLAPGAVAGLAPHELWTVVALTSLVGVAFTYWASLEFTSIGPAIVAGLLLALSPLHARYATMVMSEVPSTAVTAAWAFALAAERYAAIGLLAGVACSLRLMTLPLLIVGAAFASRAGGRGVSRFAVGALLGLSPILLASALEQTGPFAGYRFWVPGQYGAMAATFTATAIRDNWASYARALLGLEKHPLLYPLPVALCAVAGAWTAARTVPDGRRRVGALASAAGAQVALALSYFFRDARFLLPALPLLLILAACGLERLARWRPSVASVTAVALIALQLRGVLHDRDPPSVVPCGPRLAAMASHLPDDGVIVSDVPAALAWLYWVRGTGRRFLPLDVPPWEAQGDLVDTHVRRLAALRTNGRFAGPVPSTLIVNGALSDRGREVLRGDAGALATIVACTRRGRDLVAAISPSALTELVGCAVVRPKWP